MKRSKAFGFLFVLVAGMAAVYTLSSKNVDSTKVSSAPLNEVIPPIVLDRKGNSISSEVLKGKYVGIYFSASWCGPCRSFTPELIEFRNQHAKQFEVLLVGGDGSTREQEKYVKQYKMPWYAMINQSEAAKRASQTLGVEFIPCLVILDPSGNVVSKEGVSELRLWKKGAMDYWSTKSGKDPV